MACVIRALSPTALPEVLILEPTVFGDERGFFYESFNQRDFGKVGMALGEAEVFG